MKTDICTFTIICPRILLRVEMFQAIFVKKIKIHILQTINPPPFENCGVYGTMRKNTVESGRPHRRIYYGAKKNAIYK